MRGRNYVDHPSRNSELNTNYQHGLQVFPYQAKFGIGADSRRVV
jgi:hypothetical protein